jgi:hypothetical protein
MLATFTVTETLLELEPLTDDPFIAEHETVGRVRPAKEPAKPLRRSQRSLVEMSLLHAPDRRERRR